MVLILKKTSKNYIIMDEYDKQVQEFLDKTKTEITIEYKENNYYFKDDRSPRDIYDVTLKRGSREYKFTYGNSLIDSKHYVSRIDENVWFTLSGINLKGRFKCTNEKYLKDYCKLIEGKPPKPYDILACLEKYDYESFEDFCSELGYDTDSRNAERIYNACKDQYLHLISLYNEEEMEMLREIQ
jgi:hypothetical protein